MYTDSDIAHILTDDRFFLIYLRRYVLKGGYFVYGQSAPLFLKLDHNISAGHAKSDYNDSNEKIWSLYVS